MLNEINLESHNQMNQLKRCETTHYWRFGFKSFLNVNQQSPIGFDELNFSFDVKGNETEE